MAAVHPLVENFIPQSTQKKICNLSLTCDINITLYGRVARTPYEVYIEEHPFQIDIEEKDEIVGLDRMMWMNPNGLYKHIWNFPLVAPKQMMSFFS